MSTVPNPGSDRALDLGCTCPVLDNRHGEGFMALGEGPFFWSEGDCQLHGHTIEANPQDGTSGRLNSPGRNNV